MLKRVRISLSMVLVVSLIFSFFVSTSVFADTKGTFIYGNTTDNRSFYERAVKLSNGDLLCTFMRSFPPADWSTATKSFYFYKSSDGGKTWNMVSELNSSTNGGFPVEKQGMEALYVLPQQCGNYPAGTILFATTDWAATSPYSIHIWRSTDNGTTWQYHSSLAARGTNDGITKGNNNWEPEFAVSSDGRLVCYYSDERQIGYDQCIVREISNDGGITWGNYSIIVGRNDAPTGTSGWRPGMPRVLKLKNGNYFMAYENINSTPAGAIRFKISTDGINWGNASDLGTLVATSTSGAYQCPEVALVDDGSTYGRLFVRGMNDSCSASKCFTSKDNGATWSEIDAPLTVVRNEGVGSSWSGTFVPVGNVLYEINNYFNGSYNEIRFGTGVVNTDGIIVSGAFYKLTNKNSNLCLDDAGGSTTPGTQMIQWTDNSLETQMWKADYMGNNFFKLINKFSGLCLDNYNGLSTPGNKIIQWTDNGFDPQRWKIDYMSSGFYKLNNKVSNLSLDVSGSSTETNALIVQNTDNGSNSERWKLEQRYLVTRLQSYNFPANYIRHNNGRFKIDNNFTALPIEDSYFKVVPAINGDTTNVSFECINMPGRYLRHRNGEVWADQSDGTTIFKNDASWKPRAGLASSANPTMVSYEASTLPGNYLRHRDGLMWLTTISTDTDRADATFKKFEQ